MKLRIQGNSVRFRLLRSEVARFIEEGRLAETTYFACDENASFTFALEWKATATHIQVRYQPFEATIVLPESEVLPWAETGQVGIYSQVEIGDRGILTLTVEKDFACLDQSDAENEDTFPNPQMGAVC